MAQPMIKIGLQANALPMANVDVIKAVFGKTNENHAIVKTIRPGPMADKCAKLAMKKKNSARLKDVSPDPVTGGIVITTYPHSHREAKFTTIFMTFAAKTPSPMKSSGKDLLA